MSKKMNLTKKLHQEFVLNKINRSDWEKGTDGPLVVELDTTEACDLACPGCISQDIMKTKNRFSDERLMEIGKEFYEAGVKAIVLIGGGEPLAHPAIGKFIEYLGNHDIHIGITTNGTFIRKHLDVIAKYSTWTRVSMDAATDELFNKLRPSKSGKSKFDFIVENMRELAKIKTGKLGFSYLIQTEADGKGIVPNVHEIFEAAKLAKDIGCDYFEVKPSYQFRDDTEHALMKHQPELMQQARVEIDRLDTLESEGFSILKAINLEYSLNGIEKDQPKDYNYCPAAELRTLVCPSGAYVCPYWRGKPKMRIGEMHNTSFSDMWNSDKRKEAMEYLDPSKHCSFHCLRHDSNIEAINLINNKDNEIEVEKLKEFDRFI